MQMTRYTKQGRQVGVGKIQNARILFRLHLYTTAVDQISVEANSSALWTDLILRLWMCTN